MEGFIKAFFKGESMWLKDVEISEDGERATGTLDNKPVFGSVHGYRYTDTVACRKQHDPSYSYWVPVNEVKPTE